MKKKTISILIILALAIAIFYYPPISNPDFAETYQNVDKQTSESLAMFRKNYPPQHIMVDNIRWNYLVTGSGAHTILFLHGMTGSYNIWWQQILDLKKDYRIVSVTYPPVNSLKELGVGVMKILDSAGIPNVNVVGSSLGGYLSQYLVATYPQRIEKAVFANTFPPNTLIAEKNRTIGKLLPYIPSWIVMKVLRNSLNDSVYPASENSELVNAFILEQSYGMMTKNQFVARFYCVIDSFKTPHPNDSGIPVMIIESDNDPLVEPELREMLRQAYPTARVETLHNKGHFPYLNEPVLYTSLLKSFFQ